MITDDEIDDARKILVFLQEDPTFKKQLTLGANFCGLLPAISQLAAIFEKLIVDWHLWQKRALENHFDYVSHTGFFTEGDVLKSANKEDRNIK